MTIQPIEIGCCCHCFHCYGSKKSIICFQIELRWAKDIQTIKTTIGKKKGNLTASSLPKVHTKYVYDDEEMRRKRKEFLIGELPSEYFIAFRVCDISELLFFSIDLFIPFLKRREMHI